MTTATLEKDEDLIILGDDSSHDNSILGFNFDIQAETPSKQAEPTIIFWDDIKTDDINFDFNLWSETTSNQVENEIKLSDNVSEISFSDDMFNLWSETTQETPIIVETTTHQDDLVMDLLNFEDNQWTEIITNEVDFWFTNETNSNEEKLWLWDNITNPEVSDIQKEIEIVPVITQKAENISSISNQKSFNRNDILDEAVAKMQIRKDSISQTNILKQAKVDELNKQIIGLKKEVSNFESEIKDLEKEDKALDLDISSIEKMKANISEIVIDRTRKHNLDNIKKN